MTSQAVLKLTEVLQNSDGEEAKSFFSTGLINIFHHHHRLTSLVSFHKRVVNIFDDLSKKI